MLVTVSVSQPVCADEAEPLAEGSCRRGLSNSSGADGGMSDDDGLL